MKQLIQKTTRIGLSLFLLAGLLAGFLALSGVQTARAQTQTNTINYYDWFDLETGTVVINAPTADFYFAYNGGYSPPAVVFQNQGTGVQIAYSAEDYANVTFNDVASLTFTTSLIDQGFNQVAVLLTPGGNYFKIGFVSGSASDVTFQWEQLIQCQPGQYDDGTGCVDADPGYYVDVAGATEQTPCPAGKFQPASGATSCDPAEPGHFVATTASIAQFECDLGSYQPDYGANSCILASPDYYVDTTGAIEQTMCQAGYTSEAGATECTPLDNQPPTASPTQSPAANSAGWNNSNVTVTWNWVDNAGGSGIDNANCTTSSTSSGEGSAILLSATCKDLAGNTGNASYTVRVDKTVPTLNPVVSPNPILLNGVATVTSGAADGLSGLASQSCGALDTSSIGSKTVICSATDNAGNTSSTSVLYSVLYNFEGFASPVDNSILNVAKAGQAIPLKWRVTDANGIPVTNLSAADLTVSVTSLACGLGTTADQNEELAAGKSGLQNLGDGYYQFNWKTPKSYKKSCKTLTLDFGEGTAHTATFQFKK